MITEETIARVKASLQREKAFLTLEVIEDLEKQIEKMKCYGNCKHWAETKGNCMLGGGYCICDMWELAE